MCSKSKMHFKTHRSAIILTKSSLNINYCFRRDEPARAMVVRRQLVKIQLIFYLPSLQLYKHAVFYNIDRWSEDGEE
jgi:hypothetical protein